MIITLQGKITHMFEEGVVLDVNGVGYEVFLSPAVLGKVKTKQEVTFWTYEHIREDSYDIYGFQTLDELEMYRKLVSVSGVGPKTALHILALGDVAEIERLIDRGDVEMITRVKGIGRKTAQKIILELKGKLVQLKDKDSKIDDVVAALVGMGVDRQAAREATTSAAETEKTVEGRLKEALRQLGR